MINRKVGAQAKKATPWDKIDWIRDPVPMPFRPFDKEIAKLTVKELDRRLQYLKSVEKVLTDQRKIVAKQFGVR